MYPQSDLLERLTLAEQILRETPIVPLFHPRVDLYTKLEFMNGVGSIKDRPALWVLKRAIERGEITRDTTIVESSSGNFACALAVFCRILKLEFIPVIDPLITPLYEIFLRANCARVEKVEDSDSGGSFLKARLNMVQTLLHDIPNSFWTNQYENLDGMSAHYELTAEEICRSMTELDYVFLGVSSGGTIAGVSRRMKEHFKGIRVVAEMLKAQSFSANRPRSDIFPA